MEWLQVILVYGLLNALLLTLLILASFFVQPRIWMQDLPKEVQITIPPKTKREKEQSYVVMVLFLFILSAIPIIAMKAYSGRITLLEAWLITFGIYLIFNLTDLLIIDWLIVCTITPDFMKIKGVDDQVYKNYSKHLKDFFKGILPLAILAGIVSAAGYFIFLN